MHVFDLLGCGLLFREPRKRGGGRMGPYAPLTVVGMAKVTGIGGAIPGQPGQVTVRVEPGQHDVDRVGDDAVTVVRFGAGR